MKSRWEGTHCCDEAVEGLSPLRILDCDWTEVVTEPDGGDDPARVAVRNVFLCGMEEERTNALQMLSEPRLARQIDSINTETVNPIMFRNQFRAIRTIHYYLWWSLWVITGLVSDKSLKSNKWFIKNKSWLSKTNERRGCSNVFRVIIWWHLSECLYVTHISAKIPAKFTKNIDSTWDKVPSTDPCLCQTFIYALARRFWNTLHHQPALLLLQTQSLSVNTVLRSVLMVCWHLGNVSRH